MPSLLLEIGSEELPAAFVDPALEALRASIDRALDEARLAHSEVVVHGTPRRLTAIVAEVADRQPDESKVVTGPPERASFDAEGKPTKAAVGFAKGQGVEVESLEIVDTPKGRYVAAKVESVGVAADEVLPGLLQGVVAGLPFKKSMRWGEGEQSFARPVHWICARFGGKNVKFSFADVESGSKTYGHRFHAPAAITLRSAKGYLDKLREAKVLADPDEREAAVQAAVEAAVKAADPAHRVREDAALRREVTHLVEWPVAIVGHFDEAHLDLPREVLISEMREHQKYFAVERVSDGALVPSFVAVSNTEVRDPAVARKGYERVLSARLADARHFFDTDRKNTLESRMSSLERVVFQKKLGTVAQKAERIRALAVWLASKLGLESVQPVVDRAATLAKVDLVTGMVGEFPELQGIMGRHYATLGGESEAVALAIEEHYLPRHAGDRLPTESAGALVGLADRFDSLVGLFGIGKPPTGTADPFGLRRACLAIVNVVLDRGYRIDLGACIEEAAKLHKDTLTVPLDELKAGILDFFRGRLRHAWAQEYPVDVVEAVLSAGFGDILSARERVEALTGIKERPEFDALAVAFTRAANIVAKAPTIDAPEVDTSLFEDDSEARLWKQGMAVREKVEAAYARHDYRSAFQEMVTLRDPVDAFFEKVLVMAEDARVRDNRLLLLTGIALLFDGVADFSQIQTNS
ncbi:MAG: glycine--tRNA ligase subunit beta [Deltaproteobacteria bacterium]|nr:glycine--tRNA ligase subunit beta [Deltaproteobacteria bacterium]